ncbi:MAG TPA: hypothetical protein VFK82_04815 [Burkholderiaceae bacterium]|nr:hypothetical protein [Burkholderiaceae bacterium]
MAHASDSTPYSASAPTSDTGIQFPVTGNSQRSSSATGKGIFGAALAVLDAPAAAALQAERNWRKRYAQHLHRLTAAMLAQPTATPTAARAGLDAAHAAFVFTRGGEDQPLARAMAQPGAPLEAVQLQGRAAPAPWVVPYRGQLLQGDALRRQIDAWLARDLLEPGAAAALQRASREPGWFDLRDRSIALLGAGAEAGPLRWLTAWGARVAAIDLPRDGIAKRIAGLAEQGAGEVLAPQRPGSPVPGADLLADTPELAAWLCERFAPPGGDGGDLDVLALAYADGERHARVAMAMDALIAAVQARLPKAGIGFLATPTDSFAVPPEVAAAGHRRWANRSLGAKAAHALSLGRAFAPNLTDRIEVGGAAWNISDCSVLQQGPNYALAKRLQHWRALSTAAAGRPVSINVAPSTNTWSVVKNRLLAAGFAGADLFGLEVFEPDTTNALMAALWVHDLRTRGETGASAAAGHPLALLSRQAFHGGLWRLPYVPASALAVAAVAGLLRRKKT